MSIILSSVADHWFSQIIDTGKEGMANHFSILAWRMPWTEAWWATVHGVAKESRCKYQKEISNHASKQTENGLKASENHQNSQTED